MCNDIKDVTADINGTHFVSATSRLCIELKMRIYAVLNLPHLKLTCADTDSATLR